MPIQLNDGRKRGKRKPIRGGTALGGKPSFGGNDKYTAGSGTTEDPFRASATFQPDRSGSTGGFSVDTQANFSQEGVGSVNVPPPTDFTGAQQVVQNAFAPDLVGRVAEEGVNLPPASFETDEALPQAVTLGPLEAVRAHMQEKSAQLQALGASTPADVAWSVFPAGRVKKAAEGTKAAVLALKNVRNVRDFGKYMVNKIRFKKDVKLYLDPATGETVETIVYKGRPYLVTALGAVAASASAAVMVMQQKSLSTFIGVEESLQSLSFGGSFFKDDPERTLEYWDMASAVEDEIYASFDDPASYVLGVGTVVNAETYADTYELNKWAQVTSAQDQLARDMGYSDDEIWQSRRAEQAVWEQLLIEQDLAKTRMANTLIEESKERQNASFLRTMEEYLANKEALAIRELERQQRYWEWYWENALKNKEASSPSRLTFGLL